jgi:excisionase family DNA binding protein
MEEKEFYSLPELAKILGISRMAVHKKVKAGLIKARRAGRSYIVDRSTVDIILGKNLDEKDKEQMSQAVKKVVAEYGDVLKKLGKE